MSEVSDGPAPSRPRVLLVDDEAELHTVLRAGLEPEYQLETAETAEEAETRMGGGNYDVIICDYMLPRESGLDFLMRMSEQFPATRRIMLTGYINPELVSRSVSMAGLSACLVKPMRAAELADQLRDVMSR